MGREAIPNKDIVKFLGLHLDRKLSYTPHMKQLKIKCTKSLDILKCLSHQTWGSDRITLLRIYRALIRSQLDYACQIYSSTTRSSVKMLDSVHHQALQICTGTFRSTPVLSLYAETGESSLLDRRDKLSLQLYVRLLSMPDTPAYQSVIDRTSDHYFDNSQRLHTTIGYRTRRLLTTFPDFPINVKKSLSYNTPTGWCMYESSFCNIHASP
jgi:hypothetical protein